MSGALLRGLARQEEVLRGSLARNAASLGLYGWHFISFPHLIPTPHCPGDHEPWLFLEKAPAKNPGRGEGAPPDHHSHSKPSPMMAPLSLCPTMVLAPYMGEMVPMLKLWACLEQI